MAFRRNRRGNTLASAVTELSSDTPAETPARTSLRALATLFVVALLVYGFDQLTKFLIVSGMVEGQQVTVLGPVLQFHFVKNSGAAFSFASGSTWIFSIVAAAVAVFIIWYARRIRSTAWEVGS